LGGERGRITIGITPDRPDRGLGKVDLLGVVAGILSVVELKCASGSDTPLRALVEGLAYLRRHRGQPEALRAEYPYAAKVANPYRALLDAIVARQAQLVAHWMLIGFIHGVMNTDNCSIAGETIDYGPCAFMDTYHPDTVFSSIDHRGRYAYANQPRMALWNLARFAQTLLPLLGDDDAQALAEGQAAIDAFPGNYEATWRDGMAHKPASPICAMKTSSSLRTYSRAWRRTARISR
jgi:hypothetical protein